MKRNFKSTWTLALILLIGAVIAAPMPAAETVKVGLLAPMTGPSPDWGKKQAVAIQMAVEEANRRGGIAGVPLEAVIADSAADPQTAVARYRQMAADGVLVVIGPLFTGVCEALFPVTNEVQTAVIATASTKPGLSDLEKRPYAFRMTVTSDKKEGPAAKAWVAAHKIGSVIVLYDAQTAPWPTLAETVWPDIMRDLNVNILNREAPLTFGPDQEDFTEIVRKAAGYPADGICIAALPEAAGRLVREIRRQGLVQPILGGSALATPRVVEIAGAAAEDLWSVSLFNPQDSSPKVRAYVAAFEKRCVSRYPDMNCQSEQFDVVVHDILLFVADIMKKKQVTGRPERRSAERHAIRDGLAEMGIWRGTAGMMAFDRRGDGIRTVHVMKVKDGQWQPAF